MTGARASHPGRVPDWLQVYLVVAGIWIVALQGRKLPSLRPPLPPADLVIEYRFYLWMAVLFGAALVSLGLALTNESVFGASLAFRYTSAQRVGLLASALALSSPGVVTVFGPLAGFSDTYLVVWFLSYLVAFCGLAGSVGVVLWRFWKVVRVEARPEAE